MVTSTHAWRSQLEQLNDLVVQPQRVERDDDVAHDAREGDVLSYETECLGRELTGLAVFDEVAT